MPASRRFALPRVALAMRRGTLAAQPGVVHVRGDEIVLAVAAQTPFNVDGDLVRAGPEIAFGAEAAAFGLIVQ